MDKNVRELSRICEELSIQCSPVMLHVSIMEQCLRVIQDGLVRREYPVSTSINPPNCVENSHGTPLGLHRVEQKFGGDAKVGTVFFSRVSTQRFFWQFDEEMQKRNLITTRILWLKGLEKGKNSGPGIDSFKRYIYVHGTNHEDRLGKPATGGCVVMGNTDIVRLYDEVPTASLVYISDSGVQE